MNIIERIKQHEGLRLKPYRCSTGKLTIGYGRNLEDCGISKEEAKILLENDIKKASEECRKAFSWYDGLDWARADVVLEMCFNMGLPSLLTFKKMITAIEAGNYSAAADEMLSSLWARQVGSRANTLADIMKKGK